MRISDLTQEERKAFEAHLLSTYRYDAATGKLINKKWNTPSFSQGNRPLERYQDRQPY